MQDREGCHREMTTKEFDGKKYVIEKKLCPGAPEQLTETLVNLSREELPEFLKKWKPNVWMDLFFGWTSWKESIQHHNSWIRFFIEVVYLWNNCNHLKLNKHTIQVHEKITSFNVSVYMWRPGQYLVQSGKSTSTCWIRMNRRQTRCRFSSKWERIKQWSLWMDFRNKQMNLPSLLVVISKVWSCHSSS